MSNDEIILTYVNSGYIDFAFNWLESLDRFGLTDRVVAYTLDDESHDALKDRVYAKRWNSPNYFIQDQIDFRKRGWAELMWNKAEAIHAELMNGNTILYSDTDIVFVKNPLPYLREECEDVDVCFQVAGGKSICPGFLYTKNNDRTKHLFNIDRDDFKQGYIECEEDGEIKKRKFKEDMTLLNLRLHRAIEPDDVSYKQLSAQQYPQGVHWERNIEKLGREEAEKRAVIIHFNCTVGWSNPEEEKANGLDKLNYHDKKVWNLSRHDMWLIDK